MKGQLLGYAMLCSMLLSGCEGLFEEETSTAPPAEGYAAFFEAIPQAPVYPANKAYDANQVELGELLFWDPVLSGNYNVACASCHHPEHAWADGRALSIGADGIGLGSSRSGTLQTPVHAPTALNSGFAGLSIVPVPDNFESGPYFWDLRAQTLEAQALGPIQNAVEMRGDIIAESEILDVVVERLNAIPEYVLLFEQAFSERPAISAENLANALAAFQRQLISQPTRFDRFLEGEETALSAREVDGLNKFINAGCADCHSGPMLSDYQLDPDMQVVPGKPAVRTPSLRDIELTPPYMHDGSRASLRDAIAIYEERGDLGVSMEDEDIGDIHAFLLTLTSDSIYREIPESVPSGFPVGGDIQ